MKALALAPCLCLFAGLAASEPEKPGAWQVAPEPALMPGLPHAWDDYAIANPSILRLPHKKLMMFYEGVRFDRDGLHHSGGFAESGDGIAWTKYDQNPLLNPVLQAPGTWTGLCVARWKEKFWAGFSVSEDPFRREKVAQRFDPVPVWLHVVRSDDGLLWLPVNTVNLPAGSKEFFSIRPCVYGEENLLHLWWIGPIGERDRALFHSVSRDGETWSAPNQQPAKEIDNREICCARVYASGNYYLLSYVAYDESKQQHFLVTKTSRDARSWSVNGPPEFLLPIHWMHSAPVVLFQPDGARLFYCAKEADETVSLHSAWCSKSDYASR
jgi:hypothetical protein